MPAASQLHQLAQPQLAQLLPVLIVSAGLQDHQRNGLPLYVWSLEASRFSCLTVVDPCDGNTCANLTSCIVASPVSYDCTPCPKGYFGNPRFGPCLGLIQTLITTMTEAFKTSMSALMPFLRAAPMPSAPTRLATTHVDPAMPAMRATPTPAAHVCLTNTPLSC